MSTTKMFAIGLLSIMTATGLCGGSNGFAADGGTTNQADGMTADTDVRVQTREATGDTRVGSDGVKMSVTPQQVVDAKGNVYLLIPLQTKEGKAFVEYTMPTSH